jgi:prepilin-type N-terminal cleavage/methylation domain-containing protein
MSRGPRGVTLVELLVAMVLLTLLTAAALRAMLALGRQSVAVTEHAAVQAGVRTGLLLAQAELRELGADASGSDLLRIAADSVTFRAMRGFGVTCAVSATQIRVRDDAPLAFNAIRAVVPGRDSLLLFVEGDTASSLDDRWVRSPVLSVGASSCGGTTALAFGTVDLAGLLGSGTLDDVLAGGPVRAFEVVRLAEYTSAGQRWLGFASVSGGETIQPVAGPLTSDGLTLEYLDTGGGGTSTLVTVRSVRVTLVGASERAVARGWSGGPKVFAVETVSTRLSLRNTPR